jgi:hypothetical protein
MCGFDDVRKDADGFYCSMCQRRFDEQWEKMARLSVHPYKWAQLQERCRSVSANGDEK